ncbi:rrbosomal protein S2 and tRNA/rRNA methyltransferase [Trichoderma parareesei]|uniref:rRNA methyltransferase 1, mitochondrial n=1 Tax=Trichoderma parareesei TaxID=858221 RepID=A0A2H2ZG68_TRIPA|nr:rrbosomal protein S2 and tRNA/rRNA methyltransferase [Trichoderma parareesei]
MISLGQLRANGFPRHLLNSLNRPGVYPLQIKRPATLSAIHRGVRRSERVQYGDQDRSRDSQGRGRDGGLTRRALDGASSPRQQQKLRKKLGRKAAEEEEESTKETRRKRFLNPDASYGKRSLVYQIRHGDFKEQAASLVKEPVRPLPYQRLETRPRRTTEASHFAEGRSERSRHPTERSFGRNSGRRNDSQSSQFTEDRSERSRYSGDRSVGRISSRRDDIRASESAGQRSERSRYPGRPSFERTSDHRDDVQGEMDRPRPSFGRSSERPVGRRDEVYDNVETPEPRERRNQMMAMNIKYTTAASQFLYGKSVVKAALEQGRRKLYKLFIYGGENRKDSKDNAIITRLAERRGVPITIIPNEDQRLMDKMSMGRPHNGFVLETSPLPRLPVKSLGRLEETLGKLGFHVELDHQSREEEAINGKDTFIPRKNNNAPKPFVLLLNEILDPGNLGGILRTASYFGVDAVGITNRSSSTLTPVVLKSAAGAVEEITIFSVDSPVSFIEESRKHGWKTYAAVAPPDPKLAQRHGDKFISTATVEAEQPLSKHPSILVLGNEGHGLSKPIKVAADYELSVPYFVSNSCVDSLNVSVAAGLLCHAFVRAPPIVKPTAPKLGEEAQSEVKTGTEKEENQDGKESIF